MEENNLLQIVGSVERIVYRNEDNGYTEAYDIRYDTRIRRDLGNFDSYVKKFIDGELTGVVDIS